MRATEPTCDDNPRWLAALATAAPVALAALFVMWLYEPDARRLPPAKRQAPAAVDPNWHTTVVRAR